MFRSCAQELLDHDAQSGTKKPKLLENLAHVVPGTTQQRMYHITFNAFEEVSSLSAIRLHVSNHRLDRIPALELSVDRSRQPKLGTREPDFQCASVAAMAPVASVRVSLLGLDTHALCSRRASVGNAMALSWTVVSTLTTASELLATVQVARPAQTVSPTMNSQPAWPIRLRKSVIRLGSMGASWLKYCSPHKCC